MTKLEEIAWAIRSRKARDAFTDIDIARAAVEAMITPSDGMMAAFDSIYHASGLEVFEGDRAGIIRAMCRAILDEKPS